MEYMLKIREKTSLLHSAAEHSGYIKRLVEGNASKEGLENIFLIFMLFIKQLRKVLKRIKSIMSLKNL